MSIDDRINKWNTWLWENFASYSKDFGDHSLTLLAGYSAQKYQGPDYSLHSGPMIAPGDEYAYHSSTLGRDLDQVGGGISVNTMASMFGRLSYSFKEKYLFETSIRRDGASVFPTNKKFGVFPSASLGWVVSSEDFFGIKAIDYLKVRASWGENGSRSNLPGNEDKEFWTFGGIRYPDANGDFQSGAQIDKLTNPDLKWERTQMTDVGVDFRFLNSKLTLSVDYYNKLTKDLIVLGTGPLSVGNDYPFVNGGDVSNKGIDFELGYRESEGDFKYGATINFSTEKNMVEKLSVDAPVRGDNLRGYDLTWFEAGQPIWYFKGYKTNGVDPATGDVIVVDVNGDGDITAEDQTYIGDPHPSAIFGGNIYASYKGFDFNVSLQGSYGNDVFMGWYRTDRPFSNKPAYFFEDRWTPSNTNASFPAANNVSDYVYRSDLMISDGSYLRVKQIQLGYTVPSAKIKTYGIQNLRLYVSLDDYFTLTGYKGLDPEAGSSNNLRQGVDRGLYPNAGKMMFGLSLSL
jgi:TonB-linked SusC/RagA family outer membrane protein